MNGTSVELPVELLAAVVEREKAGELHLALQPEPMWLPRDERDATRSARDAELAELGLVDRRGRLDPDFLDWLPLLTNAALEYYGWVFEDATTWGLLVAARGLQGLFAVRDGEQVRLEAMPRTDLAETLAYRLPEVGAGGGRHWSVGAHDFQEVQQGRTTDRAAAATAKEIEKVAQRPVLGGGELHVAERDEFAGYRRLEQPLRYVDTDWGRYLNYRVGSGDEAMLHVAPATPATIASTLESLRGDLTPVQPA